MPDLDPSTNPPPPAATPTDTGRYADAAELLKALAHPARLRIAIELGDHEACVHELVDVLGLPQPAVSQHLQVLRAARVVAGRRVGREVRYALVDHHVAHIANDALIHAGEHHAPDPPGSVPTPADRHETADDDHSHHTTNSTEEP